MSYDEYRRQATDDKIMEWVEGETLIYMPPVYKHQTLTGFLYELLHGFIRFFDLGVLILAPFEVKLWPDGPSREPDLIFISHHNLPNLTEEQFQGGPDLIVEIISPHSVTEDRVRKFNQYEQAGVREYWLIDPRPRQQQADFYLLGADKNYHPAPLDEEGCYRSTVLPNFWLRLDWLWQTKLPDPQLALAKIVLSIPGVSPEVTTTYQAVAKLLAAKEPPSSQTLKD
jgi:Uma2 family endonuclease